MHVGQRFSTQARMLRSPFKPSKVSQLEYLKLLAVKLRSSSHCPASAAPGFGRYRVSRIDQSSPVRYWGFCLGIKNASATFVKTCETYNHQITSFGALSSVKTALSVKASISVRYYARRRRLLINKLGWGQQENQRHPSNGIISNWDGKYKSGKLPKATRQCTAFLFETEVDKTPFLTLGSRVCVQ